MIKNMTRTTVKFSATENESMLSDQSVSSIRLHCGTQLLIRDAKLQFLHISYILTISVNTDCCYPSAIV